jgi:DNA-binding beta-propeller fold protein YncE
VNGNNIFISGMDSISQTISIIHSGSFAPGSYPLGSALFSNLNKTYTSNIGSLHITEWDSTERFLSGFFSFKAFSGPSDSVMVTDGFFAFSPY